MNYLNVFTMLFHDKRFNRKKDLMKKITLLMVFLLVCINVRATYILIPMEHDKQANHLKAYGVTFWVINQGIEAYWLLNYRGGSFAFPHTKGIEAECKVRGVSYQVISDAQWISIRNDISNPHRARWLSLFRRGHRPILLTAQLLERNYMAWLCDCADRLMESHRSPLIYGEVQSSNTGNRRN